MTILRLYEMRAVEGQDLALASALRKLGTVLSRFDGYENATAYTDPEDPGRFVFLQQWHSIEIYEEARSNLPQDALTPVLALLSAPVISYYLTESA